MQRLTSAVAFTLMLGSLGAVAFAADSTMDQQQKRTNTMGTSESSSMKGQDAKSVSGEVLKIEGETYTIKQSSGKEVRLTVNGNTKRECGADMTSDAHSASLDSMSRGSAGQSPDAHNQSSHSADQAAQDLNQTRSGQPSGTQMNQGQQKDGSSMKAASTSGADCAFKVGDKIEAQISEQGSTSTLSKKAL